MFDFTHIIRLGPDIVVKHNDSHDKHLIDSNYQSRFVMGKHFVSEVFSHTDIPEEGFARKGNLFVFMVGKAYTNGQFAAERNLSVKPLDASALMEMYVELGEELIKSIKGIFVIFIADEDKNVYLGYTSRSGLLKLHYYIGKGRLILSTSLYSILNNLENKPQFDEVAILQHGLFEHTLGERTHFKDIKILDNYCYLKHDLARTEIKPFFRLSQRLSEKPSLSWKDTNALSPVVFNKVMDLIVPETRFNSALTGGYDSRTILSYLLSKPRRNFQVFSWAADDRWLDVAIAKKISDKFGLDYLPIILGKDMLDLYPVIADQHIYWTDGTGSINRTNQMYSHSVLAKYSRLSITGYFGSEIFRPYSKQNIMISEKFIAALLAKDRRLKLGDLYAASKNSSGFQEAFLNKYREEFIESSLHSFAELDQWGNSTLQNFQYILKTGFWKFFGQEFHAQRINSSLLAPYIDDDFVDFVLTSPIVDIHKTDYRHNLNHILRGQSVYNPIMKINCPALMDLPVNRGFAPKDFDSLLYPLNLIAKFYANKRQSRKAKVMGFDSSTWNKLAYAAHPETITQEDTVFRPLTPDLLKTGLWFSLKRHLQSQFL